MASPLRAVCPIGRGSWQVRNGLISARWKRLFSSTDVRNIFTGSPSPWAVEVGILPIADEEQDQPPRYSSALFAMLERSSMRWCISPSQGPGSTSEEASEMSQANPPENVVGERASISWRLAECPGSSSASTWWLASVAAWCTPPASPKVGPTRSATVFKVSQEPGTASFSFLLRTLLTGVVAEPG